MSKSLRTAPAGHLFVACVANHTVQPTQTVVLTVVRGGGIWDEAGGQVKNSFARSGTGLGDGPAGQVLEHVEPGGRPVGGGVFCGIGGGDNENASETHKRADSSPRITHMDED